MGSVDEANPNSRGVESGKQRREGVLWHNMGSVPGGIEGMEAIPWA